MSKKKKKMCIRDRYESGARWNCGNIEALKMNYDLSKVIDVVRNEVEEKIEYTGWWYSCIPFSQIREKNLPLPLFLHRDDIESVSYTHLTGRLFGGEPHGT